MSGGVDSSVAAALLAKGGHEVIGLSMDLFACHRERNRSCCSARDRLDARAVCARIGAQLRVIDLKSRFKKEVMGPFIDEYLGGRTPSPCILCNESIKFPVLRSEATRTGADIIATGHYARVVKDRGIYRLLKGCDSEKDQSYFLFGLTQDVLSCLRLPLGELTKDEVRSLAKGSELPVHEKPDSQEICFVPDDDYATFLECAATDRLGGPGDIMDACGNMLGRHRGIHAYTVGQRRGLGVGGGPRRYVVRVDRGSNTVVLGSNDNLMRSDMTVGGVSWIHPSFARARKATVKIRSTHKGEGAHLELGNDQRVRVVFDKLVRAIAPGQAAVFYDGDEVLGGGWIEKSEILNSKS